MVEFSGLGYVGFTAQVYMGRDVLLGEMVEGRHR